MILQTEIADPVFSTLAEKDAAVNLEQLGGATTEVKPVERKALAEPQGSTKPASMK